MSRANIVLDNELVAACQKATGINNVDALIEHALRQLLRHEDEKSILALKGAVQWEGDLAAWRESRHR